MNLSNLGPIHDSERFSNCAYRTRCLPAWVPMWLSYSRLESISLFSAKGSRVAGSVVIKVIKSLLICTSVCPANIASVAALLPTKGSLWPTCSTTEILQRTSTLWLALPVAVRSANAVRALVEWVIEDVIPQQREMLLWLPVRHRQRC